MRETQAAKTMARAREMCRIIGRSLALTVLMQVPIFIVVATFLNYRSCKEAAVSFTNEGESTHDVSGSRLLESEGTDASLIRRFKPLSPGRDPFVSYSSYRKSGRTFFIVGMAATDLPKHEHPVYQCEWTSNSSSVNFTIFIEGSIYFSFVEHKMPYAPATVRCTFQENVGGDGLGGVLRLRMSVRNAHLSGKTINVLVEGRGDVLAIKRKPRFKYAFCGPPIHGTTRLHWVFSWLVYHHYILKGESHFFFHNVGGLRDKQRYLFRQFLQAGLLTIVDALDEEVYPDWWQNPLLVLNDCLHRSRFLADWVFFFDFDEYLHISPPHSIEELLEVNWQKPWMSFGSITTSVHHCRLNSDPWEWNVEQMLWRSEEPDCLDFNLNPWMCLAYQGKRKYVLNPRKVLLLGMHQVRSPTQGGVNLDASIARLHHYHGSLSHWTFLCSSMVNISLPLNESSPGQEVVDGNVMDTGIANSVKKAKVFADLLIPP